MPFLWLILPLIVAGLCFWAATDEEGAGVGVLAGIGGFVISVFLQLVLDVFLSAFIPQESTAMHTEQVRWDRLADLGSSDTLHGRFFLGSGYIESREVYRYFYLEGTGYRRGSVEASEDVKIFEQNRADGVLKTMTWTTHETDCRDKPGYGWLRHLVPWDPPAYDCSAGDAVNISYEFYIPKGSIARDYNLK